MGRAAIPDQIASCDMTQAAPGHRFYLYLEHWQEGTYKPGKAKDALKSLLALPKPTKDMLAGIRARQQALQVVQGPHALHISAISTAPFATGLGNEHPIENGFAFLTPYGLPYFAGSGVKGILRRTMQELRKEGEAGFASEEVIDALFGHENIDSATDAHRGALDFWDVFPQPKGDRLSIEIMTPHYGEYYRGKQSPHDSGAPTPVHFLAVPAGSVFDFHVVCHSARLPDSLKDSWKPLLRRAFEHAFAWVGFGAKTSVGYGAMQEDPEALKRRAAKLLQDEAAETARREQAEREAMQASMTPAQIFMDDAVHQRSDKNQAEHSYIMGLMKQNKVPDPLRTDVALHLKKLLTEKKKWKEKSEKKNPEKDGDYQDTLLVKRWLGTS